MIKYVHARYGVDCIVQCLLQDDSCRSVNYRKGSFNESYENCELLNAVDSDEATFLREDGQYDYYKLLKPQRVSIQAFFFNYANYIPLFFTGF